jgi:flavin reductase (DIM6/NTAB) family NADH-FMN oxidoreductase RutF
VINLTTEKLARATDWCGVRSGRKFDKWKEMGLTPVPASVIQTPIIEEAPISIECRVKEIVPLGTHDMFISEVVNVMADEQYLDPETGAFSLKQADPICYSHGHYFKLGKPIGKFGWSVEKKKRKKKRKR